MDGCTRSPDSRAGTRRYALPACLATLLALIPAVAIASSIDAATAAATPSPAAAERAAIAGRIIDARSDAPVSAAAVHLQGTRWSASTDPDGRFSFDGVAVGEYLLVVEHIAYESVRHTLVLEEPTATYEVVIRLDAEAIQVEPIEVEVLRATPLADVYDRLDRMEQLGLGTHFDRAAIERAGVTRVSHLVGLVPGARLSPLPGRVGATQLRLHPRNNCGPSVYIDGIRTIMGDESVDDYVHLSSVETLEVYRRLSMLPGEYADEHAQNCGAVVVWTRRGTPAQEPFGWRRVIALTGFLGFTWLMSSTFF